VRLFGVISTAVLVLAIGTTAPVCAQQEQHDQQPEQKAKPAQDNKPARPQKPARQATKPAAPAQKSAQQEKSAPQRQNNAKQEQPSQARPSSAKQEKPSAQHQQTPSHQTARTQPQQQHTQQAKPATQQAQRSGGGGSAGRIPDDRFRANFGREHTFRVSQGDYRGRRFQYGGYSFGFVDPWPANWLYTQDVFVVEIGGVYYLCNATYPGVNVALSVTI
jgi:hypothetical protein